MFLRRLPRNLLVPVGFGLAVLAACLHPAAGADDPPAAPVPRPRPETSGGPYCGVYSVYAALRSLDVQLRFEDLLEPKYVGSHFGSSLGELKQAVADFGAHAEAMEGLTASALRGSQHPIILHVRRPGLKTPYAHWILFLGVEGDKARIVDPPHEVQLLPFAELLSLWDGVGLVVSREPVQTWPVRAAAWFEQGVFLLLVAALLGAARFATGGASTARRPSVFPALLLLAVGLAAVSHLVHDEGFFRNRSAVAQVVGRHFEPRLPSLSVAEVESMLGQPDVTVIDARYPNAYKHGHLSGAVNLPIYAGLVERADVLAAVKPTDRVVVYCQSENCPWGEVIASDLVFRGYHKVSLFPGGWNAWKQHEQSKSGR